MKTSAPALALALLAATAGAFAQTPPASRPDLHDGVRHTTAGVYGFALHAPNGPGLFGVGARFSYPLHAYFELDVAGGYLRTLDAANAVRHGATLEAGVVTSGSLGVTQARIGAYATGGVALAGDAVALMGHFGLELRTGFAFGARPAPGDPGRLGLDVRVRGGVRLFCALDGADVLAPAYGVELAVAPG
ncbi:MAG: hypothetical protein U0324_46895 [Polyangiales bacterium]